MAVQLELDTQIPHETDDNGLDCGVPTLDNASAEATGNSPRTVSRRTAASLILGGTLVVAYETANKHIISKAIAENLWRIFIPNIQVSLDSDSDPYPGPEATATPESFPLDLGEVFNNLGIEVNLPHEDWPVSYARVAEVLAASDPNQAIQPEQVVAVVNKDEDGNYASWDGWFMIESRGFPFRDGIEYDAEHGYHVDSNGNAVFDPELIFKKYEELTPDERREFPKKLFSAGINPAKLDRAALSARGPDGHGGHSQRYLGAQPEGETPVEVSNCEQATLIPVRGDLCPEDPARASARKAYQQLAWDTVLNPDIREGLITPEWYNPKTGLFETPDNRVLVTLGNEMLRALAAGGLLEYDLRFINNLPAGYEVSPQARERSTAGQADHWLFNPETGEWVFVAHQLNLQYNEAMGAHVDTRGNPVFGFDRIQDIFRNEVDYSALIQTAQAPMELPVGLVVITGTAAADNNGNPTQTNPENMFQAFYTFGNGDVNGLTQPTIEEMYQMIVDPDGCPVDALQVALTGWARQRAEEHQTLYPHFTTRYWNGEAWVEIERQESERSWSIESGLPANKSELKYPNGLTKQLIKPDSREELIVQQIGHTYSAFYSSVHN